MAITVYSKDEIERLRVGGRRLGEVVHHLAEACVPGISTEELNRIAGEKIRERGDIPAFLNYTPRGAKRPFPAALCVSINQEVVHGIPNENPSIIKEGDIVGIDCGIIHEGLVTDHAVTVVAGKGDEAARKLLEATREGLYSGIKAARGGSRVGDIGAAVEKVGVEGGYGIVYELGGHGVGHKVHMEPYIPNVGDRGTGEVLVPGMVIAIEPMFTEGTARVKLMPDGYTFETKDGSRAAHFEHTVLITNGEPEILTAL